MHRSHNHVSKPWEGRWAVGTDVNQSVSNLKIITSIHYYGGDLEGDGYKYEIWKKQVVSNKFLRAEYVRQIIRSTIQNL